MINYQIHNESIFFYLLCFVIDDYNCRDKFSLYQFFNDYLRVDEHVQITNMLNDNDNFKFKIEKFND